MQVCAERKRRGKTQCRLLLAEYYNRGNHEIGIRHWKIAAEGGLQKSLNALRCIYNADGEFISKDYLESIYRACHGAQMEVASEKHWSGTT